MLSTVNSVNTTADKYTFTGISGTIDVADIVTDEDLARNDVVLVTKYADDCYYISYPDTVEGTIESYNSNNNTISVDGTSYGNSGGKNLAVTTGQEQILTEEMVDGSYIFYLDPYGNVLGALETEGVVGNYAVVQGWNRTGNSTMGYSVTVKLLMQDGTTGTYNVNLAATAVRLGVAASTDSTRDKETAITTGNGGAFFGDPEATSPAEGGNVLDHLFSYTLDGNTVTLAYPQEVNDDRYMSSNWNGGLISDDSLTSGATVNKNVATYSLTKTGTRIVANDQTVFFIKDNQGDYYVVTGLANLPSTTKSGTTDVTGIPVNATNSDTISYQAPGSSTWIARAVFLETTNTFESVRDFVFVTDKWVTKNVSGSPVYTFTVVNADGETSQMTTTQDANNLKETVREWNYDGSYVEFHNGNGTFTHHKVYISEIDGNVITLSNVDTGIVVGSYRVDGGAKIWDVQDDPVKDTLQVNDIVGVYLDSDNIVTAAFIYDTMNGAYAELPTSITLGGVALTSGATAVSATANQALPLVVTVPTDVTLSSISLNGTPITMTKSGNTYTGNYTAPASGTVSLSVAVVVAQPGRDTYTFTYTGTFEVTVSGGGASEGVVVSFADTDASNYNFYAGDSNEPLTITDDRGPNSSVTVPAGVDLAIESKGTAFVPGESYEINGKSYVVGADTCIVIPAADLEGGITVAFPSNATVPVLGQATNRDELKDRFEGGSTANWYVLPSLNVEQSVTRNADGSLSVAFTGTVTNILDNLTQDIKDALANQYFTNCSTVEDIKGDVETWGFTNVEKVGFITINVNGKNNVSCVVEAELDGEAGIYALRQREYDSSFGGKMFVWSGSGTTVYGDISALTFG